MTNVVTRICADGVKEAHPTITEEELISLLRRRFSFGRRPSPEERAATDREDIKAILKSTRVNLRALRKKARAESTSEILEDLIRN